MASKQRLKQLEKASGKGEKKEYMCVINELSWHKDEAKGYKVQSLFGGEDLHFDTLAELEAFGKRADIELTIIRVISASEDLENKNGE